MRDMALLILAAVLEVGGDALMRHGLRGKGAALVILGGAVLISYGYFVNLSGLDFSRLMGIYIAVFFLVAQLVAVFVFKEQIPLPVYVGGALILTGGATMTLWRV